MYIRADINHGPVGLFAAAQGRGWLQSKAERADSPFEPAEYSIHCLRLSGEIFPWPCLLSEGLNATTHRSGSINALSRGKTLLRLPPPLVRFGLNGVSGGVSPVFLELGLLARTRPMGERESKLPDVIPSLSLFLNDK